MIPFIRHLGKSKTIGLENKSEGVEAKGRRTKGVMEAFYTFIAVTQLCVFQNPENCTLKRVDLTLYIMPQ